jgi:hypothetical protein
LFLDLSENKEAAAIYLALSSAYTVAEQSRSRGGVSESYAVDWKTLLTQWAAAASKEGYVNPASGAFVVKRA